MGILTIAMLSFLLLSIPAEAYQNTHTLTQNDSVSTQLPSYLGGVTLYLHGKAPTGHLRTRVNYDNFFNAAVCQVWNGDCCEDQGSFPVGQTYYHTTVVTGYQSGTGIGMVTDQIKAKLTECDEQQHD